MCSESYAGGGTFHSVANAVLHCFTGVRNVAFHGTGFFNDYVIAVNGERETNYCSFHGTVSTTNYFFHFLVEWPDDSKEVLDNT
jgi:hypothetical protein